MFFSPKVLKGSFNRYYIVGRSGSGPSLGSMAKSERLFGSADSFVRGLDASDSYWRDLIRSQSDIDLRHTNKSPQVLVADLLSSGRFEAYQVPSPDELRKLASCTLTDKKTGLRYLFLPGNTSLMVQADYRKSFTSLKDAETFLDSSPLSDDQANTLVAFLNSETQNRENSSPQDARKRIAHALAEGTLAVGVAPPGAPAKPKGSSLEEVASSTKPVSLGPHTEAGYVPPVAKPVQVAAPTKPAKPKTPPQTLEQVAQCLHDAKPAVQAAKMSGSPLPASAYTLQDKQLVVKNGLQEKFLVRVIETTYAGDEGFIGKVREHGSSISWTAPLSMVEHGDTDAEALLNAFGTRHSATKSYTVLIIDTDKMNEIGDVQTIIPTNDNLYQLIAENPQLTKVEPEVVKQILNEEFAPKYEAFANSMWANDIDDSEPDELKMFALKKGYTPVESELLMDRHLLANDIAAWEIFTGNGMTRDTNEKNGIAYGPVEVIFLDKSPMTLGSLGNKNALVKLVAS